MMSDFQRIVRVARRIRTERLAGIRLKIMLPILLLFMPGLAWGFSDPNIVLPGGHQPDTAMEVLFYASLGVVFGATMCAVLMAFDGVVRTGRAVCWKSNWLNRCLASIKQQR